MYSNALKENGYKIKVLDFCNFNNSFSNFYNPFAYIANDYDINSIIDCLCNYQKFEQKKCDTIHREKSEKLS